MNNAIEIGKRIKEFRKALHLNQTELAEKLGKTMRTIQKYESGERVIFCAEVYKYKKKADIQGFDILVDSYGLTKIRNIRRIEEYEKKLQDAI